MPDSPVVLLVDNGSLQPAATLQLRKLATDLGARTGRTIEPVSLLHSSAIEPEKLDGVAAEILEPAIRRRHAAGRREFVIVPLFFGPSAALSEYIPERLGALGAQLSGLVVRLAAPLVTVAEPADRRLAAILADQVRQTLTAHPIPRPWFVLVDHGSPQPAVGAVRDRLAAQLTELIGSETQPVIAASMERRAGAAYDFNEPLLARALERVEGEGIVALLFFSPGRHAGPGGDIAEICAEAERRRPGLRIHLTALVGEHPGLIDILADRLRAVLG